MPGLNEIIQDVRLRCVGPQTPIRFRGLPDITLVTSTCPTEPVHYVSEPALAFTLQGKKKLLLGGRQYEYGAAQYLIVSVNLPIASRVIRASAREPFYAIAISLKPSLIASLLLESNAVVSPCPAVSGIGVSNADSSLLDIIGRLIGLLGRPRDQVILGPLIERELSWHLLQGQQGRLMQQIGMASGHLTRVNYAIQWIRSHYAETLHLNDVARAAAMSVTPLHRHFRAVTSMSPVQFQKQIRLQEARSRLMNHGHDIAGVGFDVGYDSPSQFSREYKRYFGLTRGHDARRFRDNLAASAK